MKWNRGKIKVQKTFIGKSIWTIGNKWDQPQQPATDEIKKRSKIVQHVAEWTVGARLVRDSAIVVGQSNQPGTEQVVVVDASKHETRCRSNQVAKTSGHACGHTVGGLAHHPLLTNRLRSTKIVQRALSQQLQPPKRSQRVQTPVQGDPKVVQCRQGQVHVAVAIRLQAEELRFQRKGVQGEVNQTVGWREATKLLHENGKSRRENEQRDQRGRNERSGQQRN